jgi:hypothetical protein
MDVKEKKWRIALNKYSVKTVFFATNRFNKTLRYLNEWGSDRTNDATFASIPPNYRTKLEISSDA